jgi:ribose 5-phosphate isomerase A
MSQGNVSSVTGKLAAAAIAVAEIPPGAVLALGTGSTMEAALPLLARIPGLRATPTSEVIADRARSAGIDLIPLQAEYDYYLDGADQVAPGGDVIKGSWGAHVREKTLAALARRRVLISDEGKLTEKLTGPVPVAVIPFFAALYTATPALAIDDNGLAIVRIAAGEVIGSAADWDARMCRQPGIVSTGLFPADFIDQIIIGHKDGFHHLITGAPKEAK